MALLNVYFHSEVLGKQVQMNVILPQRSRGMIGMNSIENKVDSYKTLYLLHGMSDDHTIWSRRTSIERYASEKGIAVVMPNGDLSWYMDMKYGGRYFTFMSQELPSICRDFFPKMSSKREDTFVAGLSMGGYGAFKLALCNPETFGYAASLSGALDFSTFYKRHGDKFANMLAGDLETEFRGSDNDLFAVAERLKASGKQLPKLYQWCGTEDFLYNDNLKMRDHLNSLGYDLTYKESEGNHSWGYWDKWIQDVLNWLPISK
jgi:putative tributyrin esterase